jgi:S-DNA-T family DNA segregation ATPase FtsK/SpoIIIE
VVVDDGASIEERQLMERLDPAYWVEHASDRGLGGTVTGVPDLGDAGITCAVRLDGSWTPDRLATAGDQVRALLGARTGLPMQIRPGARGGWAEITLRTRSAVDGQSLLWTPDRRGIGVDEITGEPVMLPHGRKLVAGASGMGKSVLLRTILMPYVPDPLSAVVYIDAKGEESALWSHCAREVIDPDEIAAVVAEVQAEMIWRRDRLREQKAATWTATPDAPRLIVVVDEGADLIQMDSKATPIIEPLSNIARQGRSRSVDLIWCTQKPTVGDGIPRQILGNMTVRAVLGTGSQTDTQQVMGSGWKNHLLGRPGLVYVQGTGRGPDDPPVAVWDASDDRLVTSLPARRPWSRETAPAETLAPAVERPALRLVKDGDFLLAPPAPTAPAPEVPAQRTEAETAVLNAVRAAAGPVRQKDVVEASGLAKGTVSKTVAKLVKAGELVKADASPAAGEVSA